MLRDSCPSLGTFMGNVDVGLLKQGCTVTYAHVYTYFMEKRFTLNCARIWEKYAEC